MTALTPDLAAVEQAPPTPAATPGAEAHPSASAPGALVLPGETSPSPGDVSVEQVLETLALARLAEEWRVEYDLMLLRLVHFSHDNESMWEAFEDFTQAVRLREGVATGALHWSEVDDSLTGPDRSEAAHDIACDRVTDAARVLLCGRRR